jgi:hypothetical protein
MAFKKENKVVQPVVEPVIDEDDAALRALGYVPSFKREFSNISTVSLLIVLKSHSDCSDVP